MQIHDSNQKPVGDEESPVTIGPQTRWQVVTGAPCSGKTAVIDALAGRGYKVVHEVARAVIDSRLAGGETLEEIKGDIHEFEKRILMEKVSVEQQLPCNELVFLDRAIPDSIAYYREEGLDAGAPLAWSRAFQYQTIFLLARLDFIKDAVRSETSETAARLERSLKKAYTDLGYAIIQVPVMDISDRVDFILRQVADAEPVG